MDELVQKLENTQRELASTQQELKSLQEKNNNLSEENKELQKTLKGLTQNFKNVQEERNSFQEKNNDLSGENQELQKTLKGLTQNFENIQEERNSLEKENHGLHRKVWFFLVIIILLIAAVLAGYYLLMQKINTLNNENETLRQMAALRDEENKLIKNKAEDVLSTIENDPMLRKYYNAGSLVYVDCTRNFSNKNYIENPEHGETITGNLPLPKFFCKEYYESSSENGFFNANGLKAVFQSLNKGDFGVRSNERFMFTTDNNSTLSEKIELLTKGAFFSLKTLKEGQGVFLKNLEEKIAQALKNSPNDEIFFRFFFATSSDGLYLIAVVNNGRLIGYYLASNSPAVNSVSISEALKTNLDQIGDGLDIYLWNPDEKLNDSADWDTCIDVFIKQLAERSKKIN